MNVEELNVGSWVYLVISSDRIPMRVDSIINGQVSLDGIPNSLFDISTQIEPIPLSDEIFKLVGLVEVDKEYYKTRYDSDNKAWGVYELDSLIQLTPDWREQPSYFMGIRYTDSPFPSDEGVSHNFCYEVKYLHTLQSMLNIVYGRGNEMWMSSVEHIFKSLKNPNLFDKNLEPTD